MRPRLLPPLHRCEASLNVRGHRIELEVRRAEEGEGSSYRVNGESRTPGEDGLHLPMPDADLRITARDRVIP